MTAQPEWMATSEWMEYMRAFLALLFVCGLIFLLRIIVKRTGLDMRLAGSRASARLRLVETLYLDPRHRLVIVRHDDSEHLLLIGASGNRVIVSSKKSGADAT